MSKNGLRVEDINRRIIRSLATGMAIDDCIVCAVPKKIRNRYLNHPDDSRVELIMKGALQMIHGCKIDVVEVYLQPWVTQEAALRAHGGKQLVPGWSVDLAREDLLISNSWDFSQHTMRERARQLVRETKLFIVFGSPPCTKF